MKEQILTNMGPQQDFLLHKGIKWLKYLNMVEYIGKHKNIEAGTINIITSTLNKQFIYIYTKVESGTKNFHVIIITSMDHMYHIILV